MKGFTRDIGVDQLLKQAPSPGECHGGGEYLLHWNILATRRTWSFLPGKGERGNVTNRPWLHSFPEDLGMNRELASVG